MGDPTTSSVHTETVAGEKKKCESCGHTYGKGYQSCPHCTTSTTKSSNARIGRTGLGNGMGKFPPSIPYPRATAPRDADPRVHSHPFTPDPSRPAICATCGMGTGAHGRMVDKPRTDAANTMMDPAALAKSLDTSSASPTLVTKESAEHRYTLGPVYVPDSTDAHGDWVDAPSLQTAVWDYVRKTGADRTIFLQHSPRPAGEWVEILTWPYAVEVELQVPGQVNKSVTTFPKNTPFMGVIWEPWAWAAVKDGNLLGFSMGGRAQRTVAHISADSLAKHYGPGNHRTGTPQSAHARAGSLGPGVREDTGPDNRSILDKIRDAVFPPATGPGLKPGFQFADPEYGEEIDQQRAAEEEARQQREREVVAAGGVPTPVDGKGNPLGRNRIEFAHPMADAVNDKMASLKRIEPEVTSSLMEMARSHDGEMTGLAYRFKEAGKPKFGNGSRFTGVLGKVERKVRNSFGTVTPEQALHDLSDGLRYTMSFPSDRYAEGVSSAMSSMREKGWKVEVENNWAKGDAYNGINGVIRHPSGDSIEIQFHTPESWTAKQTNHADYEYVREADTVTPEVIRRSYRMQLISDGVSMPDSSVHNIGDSVFRPLKG